MSEHLPSSESHITNKTERGITSLENRIELVQKTPELPDVNPIESAAQKIVALKAAEGDVRDAFEKGAFDKVLDSLEFPQDKYSFAISDTYHAEATTGSQNTRTEGRGGHKQGGSILSPQYYDAKPGAVNKWGNPRDEANNSGQPVERVGIRTNPTVVWEKTEKKLPVPGWRGKLGFKRKQVTSEPKKGEPTYAFDYEFAAPSVKREGVSQEALDAGNRAGQNIRLSIELSKEQAEALSKILENDPTAARKILDKFVEKTGDNGKWNAEIYDEDGAFHDPGERYGKELLARDVRPRYDVVPDLKPEVIGLFGQSTTPETKQQGVGYITQKAA